MKADPPVIVFDLDGTLIDSAPDLHAAAERMLQHLGRPAVTLAQVTSFIGNGVPKLVERMGREYRRERQKRHGFRRTEGQIPAGLMLALLPTLEDDPIG